jgi:HEAT repeat protein
MPASDHQEEYLFWISQLDSPNSIVRMQAAASVPLCGGEAMSAVSALSSALQDESPGVRAVAAWALGCIGPPAGAAIQSLLNLVDDTSCNVDFFVREALNRITPEMGIPIGGQRLTQGTSIPSRLADSLHQADQSTMSDMILPIVFTALHSSNPSDRVEGLRAMKSLGNDAQPLLPTIERLLHDKHYLVRLSGLLAMKGIGFPIEVIRRRLEPMIDDANDLVSTMAKEMIEYLPPEVRL